ncbi:two-component system sensor histidine kinase [Halarcobacter ebronensis]|uniref:histidine kinase n=2 Tax=Halarcobacter ebronensis TaxID=1462615 RepID=A0A4Q1ANM5_9BACT|nr:HAMP domain-containing sensor histidine kinase [Halarcobacter ebronensis]QKF82232.1 two-component system sensor histidine kinase [Halarcobacter ebronensis]RXK07734.1 two-component sensor histidine kinase [Halarcobacter ebronensis]
MLVLKSLDIDLTQSEKKTLLSFLFVYSFFTIVILFFVSFLYFSFQKDLMLQKKRLIMQEYANDFVFRLKDLHINFDKYKYYPRDEKFNSAIYDSDKKMIFSTLESKKVDLDEVAYISNSKIHFVEEPESFYLGAKYIVLEIPDDKHWLRDLKDEITIFVIIAFVFMTILGYFLLKILLKPMREALHLLDRFIKDTTHELNTPVTAIISNIEMIDTSTLDEKLAKKIKRIDIGAKTISNIYEDLTFLTLNNKIISQNENLDLSTILIQRIEYFKTLADVKKITFIPYIDKDITIFCDKKKIIKLIDNFLSNAIKYNKINGKIEVILKEHYLSIEDSGKGMTQNQIDNLFERYMRFDKSVGGFGIGLNIVSLIAKEYDFKIEVISKLDEGSKMVVKW